MKIITIPAFISSFCIINSYALSEERISNTSDLLAFISSSFCVINSYALSRERVSNISYLCYNNNQIIAKLKYEIKIEVLKLTVETKPFVNINGSASEDK